MVVLETGLFKISLNDEHTFLPDKAHTATRFRPELLSRDYRGEY